MNIKHLSTAIISDVLIEMGFENQLLSPKFRPNFEDASVFGKIRTSKLKKIEFGDDFNDIYKIVEFMPSMNEGEIIVVANGFEDMAFFGELMSTLALQHKIAAAVIDGVTRDRSATRLMKFPVFAKGTYPRDLKNKAIVESIDSKIIIDGVTINSGDYLFGDSDGIVIMPENLVDECIEKCNALLLNEVKIKELLRKGSSLESIYSECGDF